MPTRGLRQLCACRRGAATRLTTGIVFTVGVALPVACGDGNDAPAVAEVQEYLRYVEEERIRDRAGPDQQFVSYVAGGIRRLASAIDAAAAGDSVLEATVRPRLNTLRAYADAAERSATSKYPARPARDAFLLAAALLERIDEARDRSASSRELGSSAVRRAAERLRPRERLGAQQPEVQAFFERAGRALQATTGRR